MPLTSQSCEANIGDTAHRHVIEHETAFQMHRAGLLLEIGLRHITRIGVKPDTEFCPTLRVSKFDVDIAALDLLAQHVCTGLRVQASGNAMVACGQALYEGDCYS